MSLVVLYVVSKLFCFIMYMDYEVLILKLMKYYCIYGPRWEKTGLRGFCKQQSRRPACAHTQSDQRLCYLLICRLALSENTNF